MRPHLFPLAVVPADVGIRVAAERRTRRWTQGRLARRAGVARATVYRLEADGRASRADTLFRIAHALGLDIGDLVPAWPEWEPLSAPGHGPRTRARRLELGLTLAQVAAAAGVSEATLSRYERGVGTSPVLLRPFGDDVVACHHGLAIALGFRDAAEHERYCGSGGGGGWRP